MPNHHDLIFYDGHCGLCHHTVRRVLRGDRGGELFRFSPLQGDTIRQHLTESQHAALPDSIVVLKQDGRLLTRSDAVLHIMQRMGGRHRAMAKLAGIVPRPIRDGAYAGVARVRRKLFARPKDVCPMMPPPLRDRFLP